MWSAIAAWRQACAAAPRAADACRRALAIRSSTGTAIGVAGLPIAVPVLDRIARARLQASAARGAAAQACLHAAIALHIDRYKDGGQKHPGAELGCEQLQVKA